MPLDCPSPFSYVSALLSKGLQNIKSMKNKKVEGMYTLRPLLDLDTPLALPSCMYSMKKLVGPGISSKPQDEKSQDDNYDKELATLQCQQESIIEKLNSLKKQIDCLRSDLTEGNGQETPVSTPRLLPLQETVDLVIVAPPSQPPYSLLLFAHILKDQYNFSSKCHQHSSVTSDSFSMFISLKNFVHGRVQSCILFTVVWKQVEELEFSVDPRRRLKISGEANLCRYLARIIPAFSYEVGDPKKDTISDTILDAVSKTLEGTGGKERNATIKMLDQRLSSAPNIMGKDMSVVDLYVWSALNRSNISKLPPSLSKWFKGICTRFDTH